MADKMPIDPKAVNANGNPTENGIGKIDLSVSELPNKSVPEPAKAPVMAAIAPKDKAPEVKLPGAATRETSGVQGDTGLSFTNIFNKQKEATKESKVISSVLQKENPLHGAKPILGAAPLLQKSLDDERKMKLQRKLRLVQSFFVILFLATAMGAFYFFKELSPTFDVFGPNVTQNLKSVNDSLRGVQKNINAYRYKAAQLALNRFSFISDQFIDATAKIGSGSYSTAELKTLKQDIEQYATDLPTYLSDIKTQLAADIVVSTVLSQAESKMTDEDIRKAAENDLRAALMAERKAITASPDLSDPNRQNLEVIDNTLKLVGNNKLIATIQNTSVDKFAADLKAYIAHPDAALRGELRNLMGSILVATQSDVATIGGLKTGRIEWSSIIKRIEEVTGTVGLAFDPNKCLVFTLGDGICYTGYDFDTSSNKVVLSGITRTTIANNFTIISRLIDFLEESPYFANVEMRSFSKSGTFTEGFNANFKIDLSLEDGGYSSKDKPLALEKTTTMSTESGIKRNQ